MEYFKQLRKHVGHAPLILPGAVVIIVDKHGDVLLQERHDQSWGLPGGLMELGESLIETARREVREETGLEVDDLILLEILSGPEYYYKIANGDEFYSVTALYTTNIFAGELTPDPEETLSLKFCSLRRLPERMDQEYRDCLRIYSEWLKENSALKA